ncbi:MAG: inositol monophosphatase, partial [Coxiellaceae bacterium]|nr:inositol monophosphatase [Coxiellaceae bacterium]
MAHPFITIATQAARSASKIILRFMDQLHTIEITQKSTIEDIVTQVDMLSEQEIIEHIKKAYPSHDILAEENGLMKGKEDCEYCWIIDPLDGSTNYVHGFPHFAISIAVKKGDKIEAGVVYDPIRQELFSAVRGEGAFVDNRRIRVSETKKLETALIGTGFPFKKKQHIKPYLTTFESIFSEVSGIRRAGAAALDLAYVAAGRLDGFWEASLAEWDMAAGSLLIQEAGGLITDFQGGDNYLFAGNIVAGSPKIQ